MSRDRTSKNDENKNRVIKVQNSDESRIALDFGLASLPLLAENKGLLLQVLW